MAITLYYVDPAIAANSGTGTIGDPFGDLQYALNTITRNSTDGDQINVKAGTAEVLAAPLTLATFGAPGATAPLIIRGYTSAANDGGVGEIDANGATFWASASYRFWMLAELEIHNFGNNSGVVNNSYQECLVYRCEIHKGASTPSGKILLHNLGRNHGNYIHDAGTTGTGITAGTCVGNYIANCATGISSSYNSVGNIVNGCTTKGIGVAADSMARGNVVYAATGATGTGIEALARSEALNNIVVGFSGAGGKGLSTVDTTLIGYNAFYNNATAESLGDVWFDLANDVTLGADPFTDAANGDFSLTETARTALRSLGWPTSYLSAHANTDPHITIGAMQYGPAPAGVTRRVMRLLGG